MKWWLISDEDVPIIREGLEAPTHEANDFNCPSSYEECRGCEGKEKRQMAIYTLDSGLHQTDEVPRDFCLCPECGELKPDDDRVKNGMKCGQCAY